MGMPSPPVVQYSEEGFLPWPIGCKANTWLDFSQTGVLIDQAAA